MSTEPMERTYQPRASGGTERTGICIARSPFEWAKSLAVAGQLIAAATYLYFQILRYTNIGLAG